MQGLLACPRPVSPQRTFTAAVSFARSFCILCSVLLCLSITVDFPFSLVGRAT